MNELNESDILPLARRRLADRLVDARDAAVGLDDHPDVAEAVAAMRTALDALAHGIAAAGRAEKIEP